MSETNNMRKDFEAWMVGANLTRTPFGDYQNNFVDGKWIAWQAATERATAVERERCAVVCEVDQHYADWEIQCGAEGRQLLNDMATVIRQGGKV